MWRRREEGVKGRRTSATASASSGRPTLARGTPMLLRPGVRSLDAFWKEKQTEKRGAVPTARAAERAGNGKQGNVVLGSAQNCSVPWDRYHATCTDLESDISQGNIASSPAADSADSVGKNLDPVLVTTWTPVASRHGLGQVHDFVSALPPWFLSAVLGAFLGSNSTSHSVLVLIAITGA